MKRMKSLTTLVAVSLCLFLCCRCQQGNPQPVDRTADSLAIVKAINDCVGWAKEKDFDLLYSIIADDSAYLEVSPRGNITRGIEEFRKNEEFWGSSDFKAIRYEINDLAVNISAGGDVAWFYCKLDDINEWKGQPTSWENTRWTGVLEKRDGRWVIVQMHFSFAVEKQ